MLFIEMAKNKLPRIKTRLLMSVQTAGCYNIHEDNKISVNFILRLIDYKQGKGTYSV
jgi:hypothetical protein